MNQNMNTTTVTVPFNGIETEYFNLGLRGIAVDKIDIGPHTAGNIEATLTGPKETIVEYLSDLWEVDKNGSEVKELFV